MILGNGNKPLDWAPLSCRHIPALGYGRLLAPACRLARPRGFELLDTRGKHFRMDVPRVVTELGGEK